MKKLIMAMIALGIAMPILAGAYAEDAPMTIHFPGPGVPTFQVPDSMIAGPQPAPTVEQLEPSERDVFCTEDVTKHYFWQADCIQRLTLAI